MSSDLEKYTLSQSMKAYIRNDKFLSKENYVINRDVAMTITTREGQVRAVSSNYECKHLRELGVTNYNIVDNDISKLKIRKLTPRECGRLMGVSENDIDAMVENNTDSKLYKQFGNSIVVDVLYYALRSLFTQEGLSK